LRVEREGGSPPMAEDLEEQLRAAREQGQLQAAQSKVKDLHRCVALQETELQQLRRSLEARLKAEDLLKAELRMSSTMHKVTQPPMHPASAPASTPAPLHPPLPPHLCTRTSAPASRSPHCQREWLVVAVPSLRRRRAASLPSSPPSCSRLLSPCAPPPSLLLPAPGGAQASPSADRARLAASLAGPEFRVALAGAG
jgi:hypothetical protein